MLTEINKSGATTKITASVESNAVKYLKTCGRVYSELPISLLSYIDNILVVCRRIQRNLLISAFMSLKCFSDLCVQGILVSYFEK